MTRDGTKLGGAVRNEDNFSIQLQSPDGTLHFLVKSELASLEYQSLAPMPTDYGTKLSSKDLDDLVSYLHSLRSADDPGIGGEDQ